MEAQLKHKILENIYYLYLLLRSLDTAATTAIVASAAIASKVYNGGGEGCNNHGGWTADCVPWCAQGDQNGQMGCTPWTSQTTPGWRKPGPSCTGSWVRSTCCPPTPPWQRTPAPRDGGSRRELCNQEECLYWIQGKVNKLSIDENILKIDLSFPFFFLSSSLSFLFFSHFFLSLFFVI